MIYLTNCFENKTKIMDCRLDETTETFLFLLRKDCGGKETPMAKLLI